MAKPSPRSAKKFVEEKFVHNPKAGTMTFGSTKFKVSVKIAKAILQNQRDAQLVENAAEKYMHATATGNQLAQIRKILGDGR